MKIFSLIKWAAIILLLFFLLGILFYARPKYKYAIGIKEFNNSEHLNTVKDYALLGKLSEISGEMFTISDINFPEDTANIFYDSSKINFETFALGDHLVLRIDIDKKENLFIAKDIEEISQRDAERAMDLRKPVLEIKILELTSDCEKTYLTLEFKNIGNRKISYEDLKNEDYGYQLIYYVNDIEYNLYNKSKLEKFETLESGEKVEIVFDGSVNLEKGNNEIIFSWVKKSVYDEEPENLFTTEKITFECKE